MKIDPPHQSQKMKRYHYFRKIGHMEKVIYKNKDYLGEKVKLLEGDMSSLH
jgi:hypothetical protein